MELRTEMSLAVSLISDSGEELVLFVVDCSTVCRAEFLRSLKANKRRNQTHTQKVFSSLCSRSTTTTTATQAKASHFLIANGSARRWPVSLWAPVAKTI